MPATGQATQEPIFPVSDAGFEGSGDGRGHGEGTFLVKRVQPSHTQAASMAGLGLYFQKSARALAPRGLLRSAYDFLCLIFTKSPRASWKVPGQFRPTLGATRKKRFLGPPARLW